MYIVLSKHNDSDLLNPQGTFIHSYIHSYLHTYIHTYIYYGYVDIQNESSGKYVPIAINIHDNDGHTRIYKNNGNSSGRKVREAVRMKQRRKNKNEAYGNMNMNTKISLDGLDGSLK